MKHKLILITLIMGAFGLQAQLFESDGIRYNILSATDKTMEVTNSKKDDYSGNITIPASVSYDGDNYAVVAIGNNAFRYCEGLTSINVPNSIKTIGDFAFQACKELTNITIPYGVTNINIGAFSYCIKLDSIIIPNSVTTIGPTSFADCHELRHIELPSGITNIGSYTFKFCENLSSIHIPDGVTTIGEHAFDYCTNLTSINIPNSVTSMGNSIFRECFSLSSVNLSNNITTIGEFTFNACYSLNSIFIPKSVTIIGRFAFGYNSSLKEVKLAWTTPITIDESVFSDLDLSEITLKVPEGTKDDYEAADVWKEFKIEEYIPSGLYNPTAASTISTYPNPVRDAFKINSHNNIISISLFDIHGKQVLYKDNITAESLISISELPKGIYLLDIHTEHGRERVKVVKK